MTSEIRVNKIENRSGLGTVTFADTGVDLAGIVTATTFSGSGASLTDLPAASLTGTVADARLTTVSSSKLSGALPALDGSALTGVASTDNIRTNTDATFLKGVNVSGIATVGSAVTISESGIDASGIGITCANINGTQIGGRRNLIMNGAMVVAQRGTADTTSSGFQTVDRFEANQYGVTQSPSQSQTDVASGTTPYTEGFRKAYKLTNGNQGTVSNDAFIRFKTTLEAQDIANSGWNYVSSSSFITLSFWIKSSVAQNFYGRLQTEDGTARNFPFETGSLAADTWTKVVKTIPGSSSPALQFDQDVNTGLILEIVPWYGSDYTGSVSLDTWATYSDRTPDYGAAMDDWYLTNNATLEITGVQLEVGSQATPFEHRSYGEELALCQRYYQQLRLPEDYANGISASYLYRSYYLPVTQRTTGTGTVVSQCRYYSGGSGVNFTPDSILPRIDTITVRGINLTSGNGFIDGTIGIDAEF